MIFKKYNDYYEYSQKKINDLPLIFAFGTPDTIDKKMKEKVGEKWRDKVVSVGAGGVIEKSNVGLYLQTNREINNSLKESIDNDQDGTGFVYSMFYWELCNHEYMVTYDSTDTLMALGYTIDEVLNDVKLRNAFLKATKDIEKEYEGSEW